MSETIQRFEEVLTNARKGDIGQLDGAVQDLIGIFGELKEKLQSSDQKEQAAAFADLEKLQSSLEGQIDTVCKDTGLERSQLRTYMNDPSHFSPVEWNTLQKAQNELKDYEKSLVEEADSYKEKRTTSSRPSKASL